MPNLTIEKENIKKANLAETLQTKLEQLQSKIEKLDVITYKLVEDIIGFENKEEVPTPGIEEPIPEKGIFQRFLYILNNIENNIDNIENDLDRLRKEI